MRPETREAMEMLFAAKWNVPKAAKHCNLTMKEMKITERRLDLVLPRRKEENLLNPSMI